MRPNQDDINTEVERLRELLPMVREFTAFGDSNREAIEAQILVLTEGYDEDDIYNNWPEPDDGTDDIDARLRELALDAYAWRQGQGRDAPSVEWEDLVE